jgi:hypothetical protein
MPITGMAEMHTSDVRIEAADSPLRVCTCIGGLPHDQGPPPLRLTVPSSRVSGRPIMSRDHVTLAGAGDRAYIARHGYPTALRCRQPSRPL